MSISVGVANPGSISSVGNANPGRISGVGNANPGVISSVGNSNGTQTINYGGNGAAGGTQGGAAYVNGYYGGGGGAPAPVYAPRLDIASINAQARSAAENAVNPFYTKTLNDFLAQQAADKAHHQTQADTDIKNLQDALKETMDANALTGTRTAEDTATKVAQVAETQDENQQDTGTQFEDARLAAAKAQAVAGTLATGAGNRETGVQTANRNTTEGRQNEGFQQTKDQAELFKSRTFEDLAKSNVLATTKEGKGETQVKFDLANYLQNADFTEKNKRNELEESRLTRVGQETQNQQKLALTRWLAGIKNPAQYQAAVQTYGGFF